MRIAAFTSIALNPIEQQPGLLFALREAFAAWLPPFGVPLSYAIAISYVLVDTYDKGQRAYRSAEKELGSRAALHPEVDTPR